MEISLRMPNLRLYRTTVPLLEFEGGPPRQKPRKLAVPELKSSYWRLQDAKARFRELVRKVRAVGHPHMPAG